jgi:hypothetical protein
MKAAKNAALCLLLALVIAVLTSACSNKPLYYKGYETEKIRDFGGYGGGFELYRADKMDSGIMTYDYVSYDDNASAEAITSYLKDAGGEGYTWIQTGKWAATAGLLAQGLIANADELDYEPGMAFVSDKGAFIIIINIGDSDIKLHFLLYDSEKKSAWENSSDNYSSSLDNGDADDGVVDLT